MTNKQYWNYRWKLTSALYFKRGELPDVMDIRTLISKPDDLSQYIINDYNLKGFDCDSTAIRCQRWVKENIKYVDEINEGDMWQFPFETISRGTGDCDDGSILMSSLMINAGIPNYRVKSALGWVKVDGSDDTFGHVWTLYLASDNKWRNLDWCFYALKDPYVHPLDKPIKNERYQEITLSFNNEFVWSNIPILLKGRWQKPEIYKSFKKI